MGVRGVAAIGFEPSFVEKGLTNPEVHLLTRRDRGRYTAPPSRQAVEQAFETLPEASVRARVKRDPGAVSRPGPPRVAGQLERVGPLNVLLWEEGCGPEREATKCRQSIS